jgi:hypothetical protein
MALPVVAPVLAAARFLGLDVTPVRCLFFGFALIAGTDLRTRPHWPLLIGFAVGVLLTWACVVEYTSALSALSSGSTP